MRSAFPTMRHRLSLWLVCACITAAIGVLASPDTEAVAQFGTRCQRSYQNGWQGTLPYMYVRCSGFNNELDDTDTRRFYYNLKGTGSGFTFNDGIVNAGGVDSIDLFYVGTHGGRNNSNARLALWTQGLRTFSTNWRYGNNSDQVAIFSQYACKTLALDSFSYGRWINAFRGGMIMATGSHDLVYDGWTTDETGEDYADDLQKGKRVRWAWFDGNGDWYLDQDVAVYATGVDLNNCLSRMVNLKWQNFGAFSRLRDFNMRMCASWITNN